MLDLRNKGTSVFIGQIDEDELDFLIEMLEEEDSQDKDYWIDQTTLDYFKENDCPPRLLEMLQGAIGNGEGIEIEWVTK